MKDFWTPPVMVLDPHGQTAKPATPQPPEWIDDGPHEVTPEWWAKVGEARLAALDLARAMFTPLPHDPDTHTRLMPWKGKEG